MALSRATAREEDLALLQSNPAMDVVETGNA
jgi:hypothetical protein